MATTPPTTTPEPADANQTWRQGWYSQASVLRSPNFGKRPPGTAVSLIVVHSISLPPGVYGGTEVQDLFTNQLDTTAHPYFATLRGLEVSAHFYIRRNGQLWQFVSCEDRAWHAGVSRYAGRDNCNDFSVGIELEGLEGGLFEAAQYEALGTLCHAIALHYPITHAVGHQHIAPGRKHDPGAGFDWRRLQRTLGWSDERLPAIHNATPGQA